MVVIKARDTVTMEATATTALTVTTGMAPAEPVSPGGMC